jgi:uncharacterized cupin superfamily protein
VASIAAVAEWFVVNVADAPAYVNPDFGRAVAFEREGDAFEQIGINLTWLEPGRPASIYHSEAAQEAFLVLHGEATLVVEDQERPLRRWDFVHMPPETPHVIVGAGDGPCGVLMIGARLGGAQGIRFPVSEAAARYGASVGTETDDRAEAYAGKSRFGPGPSFWPPEED